MYAWNNIDNRKDGFEKNVTEGIKWLNKVSDKNDPTDTKTNLQLYELYLNGEYVEKDIDKAVYYALKVAKTRQLFHLPQSDDTDAIIISTENIMAAEKGDDIAQVCLGTQYFLKNDFKEAQKWFKLSEEKGSFEARFIIGFRIRSRVIIVSI
jgi:TPR repeat protein